MDILNRAVKRRRLRTAACLVIAAAITASASAAPLVPGSPAFLDAEYGFRGDRFGTPVESFRGLVPVETQGPGRVCYERRDEELRLGDGILRSVRYCFAEGRLEAIHVAVEGERNTDALLAWMHASYGPGEAERGVPRRTRRVLWQGARVLAYYGEPRGPDAAQVQIWTRGAAAITDRPAREHRPPQRPGRPPAPAPGYEGAPSAGEFQLSAPRRVRRGLVTQVSVRYRGLVAPGTVRLLLPPGLEVESSVPTALVRDGEIVWEGVGAAAGNLKFKARVRPETPAGALLEIYGEIYDAAGGRSTATAAMRVQ